eukprot:GSMAST32.ASY1.ANO1.580.1 assembled CDS
MWRINVRIRLTRGFSTSTFSSRFKVLSGPAVDLNCVSQNDNLKKNKALKEELSKHINVAFLGGGEKAIERHVKKNKKILPRDRIRMLYSQGPGKPRMTVPSAGVVAGIGQVSGIDCMIIANDATVKGGTLFPIGVKKQLRAQEVAMENDLPVMYVYLYHFNLFFFVVNFVPNKKKIKFLKYFHSKHLSCRVFYNEAIMSSRGIPSVAVVSGSCTAGGASMADANIIVDKIGTIFLGGPPLVAAATGEIVTAEDLGGARVHCSLDELDASRMVRELIEETNYIQKKYFFTIYDSKIQKLWKRKDSVTEPKLKLIDLLHLIPPNDSSLIKRPEMEAIISRIVDDSIFRECKGEYVFEIFFHNPYGNSLMTGFSEINGNPVGIIANSETLLCAQGARKGAQFVNLCENRDIVRFHNEFQI